VVAEIVPGLWSTTPVSHVLVIVSCMFYLRFLSSSDRTEFTNTPTREIKALTSSGANFLVTTTIDVCPGEPYVFSWYTSQQCAPGVACNCWLMVCVDDECSRFIPENTEKPLRLFQLLYNGSGNGATTAALSLTLTPYPGGTEICDVVSVRFDDFSVGPWLR
jgi:hypothetical protein